MYAICLNTVKALIGADSPIHAYNRVRNRELLTGERNLYIYAPWCFVCWPQIVQPEYDICAILTSEILCILSWLLSLLWDSCLPHCYSSGQSCRDDKSCPEESQICSSYGGKRWYQGCNGLRQKNYWLENACLRGFYIHFARILPLCNTDETKIRYTYSGGGRWAYKWSPRPLLLLI